LRSFQVRPGLWELNASTSDVTDNAARLPQQARHDSGRVADESDLKWAPQRNGTGAIIEGNKFN
jgi:hypothetical protein